MESEGLKQFLKSVGNSVFLLNTICVGLDGVASGAIKKSDDLTISWDPRDPKATALSARAHAIKSSLVFVEEALLNYISFLGNCASQSASIQSVSNADGAAEKVTKLSKQINGALPYWEPMVVLLVRWRNKIVHDSSTDLSSHYRSILIKHEATIRENHAAISIRETLDNFDAGRITLKDFSTLIAITIRFIRHVDEKLIPSISDIESFAAIINEKELGVIYKNILGVNGKEKQERKFYKFIENCFTSISQAEKEFLFKHRFAVKERI
ncbi:hypothetical protein [Pseudoalteromonas sp. R3]|uniref:hypothetical protein n=1 Tax=Pseudoalteromonas sp. R3 TaxID=1709477 RepID=UPI0006B507A3|nr:hypothetical protein [Pseudoalteromonas sp. R3]AZZ98459.1 hypothetical protein ELR70_15865 [Pseudoalteromonas sp. R3]